MLSILVFNELSPSVPGVAASSQVVQGSSAIGTIGIATQQLDDFQALFFEAEITGAAGGTLDVYVQNSPDMGTRWYDYIHFGQLLAGAGTSRQVCSVASGAQNLSLQTVGFGLSPALANNTVLGGAWGDRFRLVMVAGAGTTSGGVVTVRIVGQRMFPWGSRAGS